MRHWRLRLVGSLALAMFAISIQNAHWVDYDHPAWQRIVGCLAILVAGLMIGLGVALIVLWPMMTVVRPDQPGFVSFGQLVHAALSPKYLQRLIEERSRP